MGGETHDSSKSLQMSWVRTRGRGEGAVEVMLVRVVEKRQASLSRVESVARASTARSNVARNLQGGARG